jgi:hypothetical protein
VRTPNLESLRRFNSRFIYLSGELENSENSRFAIRIPCVRVPLPGLQEIRRTSARQSNGLVNHQQAHQAV